MSNVPDLDFPVLCVASDGYLGAVGDLETLETCNSRALKSGYFTGLRLFDVGGRSWEVRDVEKVGNVPPAWGWRLLGSRIVRVRLELKGTEPVSLDELKEVVCAALEQSPDIWDEAGGLHKTKAAVRAASSFLALMEEFR